MSTEHTLTPRPDPAFNRQQPPFSKHAICPLCLDLSALKQVYLLSKESDTAITYSKHKGLCRVELVTIMHMAWDADLIMHMALDGIQIIRQ